MQRKYLCSIPVDGLTIVQTLNKIDQSIQDRTPIHHVVINAAKVVSAQTNNELRQAIINCDIINADGQSIVWALKFLKNPIPERVAGIDLMEALIELAGTKGYRIYFLGAEQEILNIVVNKCEAKYGHQIIAGYRNGYFTPDQEFDIAKDISESNADILFVAMSSPKKENFLNTYKSILKIPFIMGVGGSFDVFAGKVKRAPLWMQNSGLEWLYRLLQEPQRMWKRYLITNTLFILLILKEKFKSF